MKPLLVSEVFGPTFQGEGPSVGQRAGFVRLGLCNLNCRWCDTPYTWDWKGEVGPPQDRSLLLHLTPVEVLELVRALDVPLVVVTGGEPLVQAAGLGELVGLLVGTGHRVEVETNGTFPPGDLLLRVDWNISPKLPHSGVPLARAWHPAQLLEWWQASPAHVRFKFVCRGVEDVVLVAELTGHAQLPPSAVWVMPEGTGGLAVSFRRDLAERALEFGFNFSPRLHVQLWGDERGR